MYQDGAADFQRVPQSLVRQYQVNMANIPVPRSAKEFVHAEPFLAIKAPPYGSDNSKTSLKKVEAYWCDSNVDEFSVSCSGSLHR